MADEKKAKKPTYRTPRGVFVYPWLNKPDEYKNSNKYHVDLKLEGGDAAKLKAIIDAEVEKSYAQAVKDAKPDPKTKKKIVSKKAPYRPDVDDEGNETGATLFRFSQNAVIKNKQKGTETKVTIAMFDAAGDRLTGVQVYGGTEGKISFTMRPYAMAKEVEIEGKGTVKKTEAGVTLDFSAVQILKLVSGGGDRSAESYGFEKEEGFTKDEAPTSGEGDSDDAPSAEGGDSEGASGGDTEDF